MNEDLFEAIERGDVEAVGSLVEAGAEVNATGGVLAETPLALALRLDGDIDDCDEVEHPDLDPHRYRIIAAMLLKAGADVNAADERGETLLMAAAQDDMIALLLKHGANVHARNRKGLTALDLALAEENGQGALMLTEAGAGLDEAGGVPSPRARKAREALARVRATGPLIRAVGKGDVAQVAKLLDAGADIETRTDEGLTLLMEAAWKGRTEVMRLLLDRGVDVNACHFTTTALKLAVRKGDPQAAQLLLDHGADLRSLAKDRLLADAAAEGHIEVVQLLLETAPAKGIRLDLSDALYSAKTVERFTKGRVQRQRLQRTVQILRDAGAKESVLQGFLHWLRLSLGAIPGALLLGLAMLLLGAPATAGPAKQKDYLQATPAQTQWFREAKLGAFICWGPCSLAGGEIGWSRNGPRPGIQSGNAEGGVPLEVYDNLYKRFDPIRFDAREWAGIVKDSGARYVIFLTKHHDGFALWDSKLTDYKVTHTPFRRDVTAELATAFREAGLRIFWYYSQPDWHHPDYRTAHHSRYVEYLHGQIRELCTNYGRIDGIWFDGLGGTAQDWDAPRLFRMIRTLQPGALINNRAGLPGDFDTPEQEIGTFQLGRPWESCITMSTGWSWLGEAAPVKSLKECLHLLVRCAGGGGNLALDTGPMPDGRIDPRQATRYREMGAWLRRYGESIYGTTGGPYQPTHWGVSTRKGRTVYLHVLQWDDQTLRLPPLPRRVVSCTALTGGKPTLRQSAEGLEIHLGPQHRDPIDTILALTLDRSAERLPTISLRMQGSLTVGKKATASSTWSDGYTALMAFDGDESTRWGAAPESTSGWLEIDLGRPMAVGRALILEAPWNRVRRFQLQYLEGEAWRTFHEGTTLGEFSLRFEPVTAQHFRLNVLEATDVPTIWEVSLFPPRAR